MHIEKVLEHWDIKYNDYTEVQKDVWSIDDTYYLKANSDKNGVNNLRIYRRLREMGIPAPEVVSTKQGKDYITHSGSNYYITRKLEGIHLNKEVIMDDEAKAHSVGQVVARLHKAFKEITDQYEFVDNNFVSELKGWVKDHLEKCAVDSFTYGIFDDCVGELEVAYNHLERHLIYRDMHLGNLLFTDNKVTGYIDFDLTQINARIFDLAYLLVGWIVGEVDNDDFMEKWKRTVRAVIAGYQEEQKLSNYELNTLGIMMCCIEILFVAFFYSVNDQDNVVQAEEALRWLWNNREAI